MFPLGTYMPIKNFILNIWIWMQCHFVKNVSDERDHIPPPQKKKEKINKTHFDLSKKHLITCNK